MQEDAYRPLFTVRGGVSVGERTPYGDPQGQRPPPYRDPPGQTGSDIIKKPTPREQTNTSENINLPQTSFCFEDGKITFEQKTDYIFTARNEVGAR